MARMHNLRRRLGVSKIDRCRVSFKFALITLSRDPTLTPAMLVMISLRSWLPFWGTLEDCYISMSTSFAKISALRDTAS